MKRYAAAGEQLVVEFYVRNLKESCEFSDASDSKRSETQETSWN
jgi:hypothetical protein